MTFGMALVFSIRGLFGLILQNSMLFSAFIILCYGYVLALYKKNPVSVKHLGVLSEIPLIAVNVLAVNDMSHLEEL